MVTPVGRMKKVFTSGQGFVKWKFRNHANGYEYLNFPSERARRIFNYLFAIGEARWEKGEKLVHSGSSSKPYIEEGIVLHFIKSGDLSHEVRDEVFVAHPNDAVLMRMMDGVSYKNNQKKVVQFYWLSFSGKQTADIFNDLGAGSDPLFKSLDPARFRRLFHELIDVVSHEPRGYEADTSALITRMLAQLYSVRGPQRPLFATQKDLNQASEPVRHAISALTRCYSRPWTVKELSHRVGLSMAHFSRTFTREVGYSPIQYLNHYRIEQAKVLLIETKIAIEEVGRQVGVPNPRYFSELFRQLTSTSPRAYRTKYTAR